MRIFCEKLDINEVNVEIFYDSYSNNKKDIKIKENLKVNMGMPIELYVVTNYFSDLFLNYGKNLNCTPVKIQKLILILQALTIVKTDGRVNFSNFKEVVIASCGCKIPEAEPFISSFQTDGYDNNQPIILLENERENLIYPKKHYSEFFTDKVLSISDKELIIDVFCRFASYSAYNIGMFFNEIKSDLNILNYPTSITIEDFNHWIINSYNNNSISNELFQYIREQLNEN